ncbi:MAG: hypothetical protein GY810_03390 [Aureispira sp.]|nr:hypothetical protein [Aureispira sp.]
MPTLSRWPPLSLVLFGLLSLLGYSYISYGIAREEFGIFISVYFSLFIAYFWLVFFCEYSYQCFNYFIVLAILLRLALLGLEPNLSDDYFRYIWDGRLLTAGYNPFMYLPSELQTEAIYQQLELGQLYPHLNSPNYFSVYPPIGQTVFGLSSALFPKSILGSLVVMRVVYILVEIVTIWGLHKLLELLQKPKDYILIYALNPLVILELTGNLHLEVLMIGMLIWAIYFLLKDRWKLSVVFMVLAVCSKLLPLMFLPLFWRKLGLRKGFLYCAGVGIGVLLLFLPFLSWTLFTKIGSSVQLYFASFEFNGSIYYLLRWGIFPNLYSMVTISKALLPIVVLSVLAYQVWKMNTKNTPQQFLQAMLWIYTTYYFCSTTVHPWYISTFVVFAVCLPYRYMLYWTLFIGLTYTTYQTTDYLENSWFIAIEYLVVYGVFFYEFKNYNQAPAPPKVKG